MIGQRWFLTALMLLSALSGRASVFTVSNTNDNGSGSLRQAIQDVNVTPGTHTIAFNIPATDINYDATRGVWKITPLSTLPLIMRSNLTIDGHTQTINQGNTNPNGPEILLDGNHAYGSDFAFHLYNVSGVVVQGFIIGRFTVGIEISGSSAQNNIVRGCYLGCSHDAMDTLSNTHGLEIIGGAHHLIGGSSAAERNIISGNNHVGVRIINSNFNTVKGNYIGLNRTGNAAVRNFDGISIEGTAKYNLIGGTTAADRNYVSGNVAYGILAFGTGCNGNVIAGNYAGTDITGTIAVPNTYGVLFDDGASYNIIGGDAPGAGNLLSGNSGYGVFLYNPGTQCDTVRGNLIGTNASGTAALPNANGIVIDGPSWWHYIDSNVIAGNIQNGIDIHIGGSDSNVIVRNRIGTAFDGITAIPNALDGIRIGEGPCHNIIGQAGRGNIIAYNGGNGISVMTAAEYGNTFAGNAIFNNGGLGIDLFPEGVSPNDAGDGDSGPNQALNFPIIDTVFFLGTDLVVSGTLDVPTPATTRVDIYLAAPDPSGYGEGRLWLGHTMATVGGYWADTVSNATSTDVLTATATDGAGNTSEFAACSAQPTVGYNEGPAACINIYPNPFGERLLVDLRTLKTGPEALELRLINEAGQIVIHQRCEQALFSVDTRSLAPGIWRVQLLQRGREIGVERMVKQ